MASVDTINRQKACRHGQMLYNIYDNVIGRSLDLYGEYCESEIELFRQVIQPDSVVLEVGANIGAHTVFLARQVMPSGMVVAFEPQRIVYQTLCANLALNSIRNVFCLQQAVGAKRGSLVVPPLDYTREKACRYADAAREETRHLSPSRERDALAALTELVVSRHD